MKQEKKKMINKVKAKKLKLLIKITYLLRLEKK